MVGLDKVVFERRSAVIKTLEIIVNSIWLLLALCTRRSLARQCLSKLTLSPFIQVLCRGETPPHIINLLRLVSL